MTRGLPRFNWRRHILLPSLVGSAVLAAVALAAGAGDFVENVTRIPWTLVPLVLGLSLANYLLRCLRWVLLMRRLECDAGLWTLTRVFFAGLAMSASPGKVGEFLKAVWLSSLSGTPASRTAAAVFLERLLDLAAVALLSLGALTLASWGPGAAGLAAGAVVLGGVAALAVPAFRRRLLALLRHPRLSRLAVAYDAFLSLLAPRSLAVTAPLSVAAWFLEGFALWLILDALGFELPVMQAVAVYALATLAGAVSLLPGGLGSTEAALVGLLLLVSAPSSVATTATVLVRAATLWFALLLGLGFLPLVFQALRGPAGRR